MKKSELKKLISEYKLLQLRLERHNLHHDKMMQEKLAEMRHRYFHETGNDIESER